jgi:hypothetical protein
MTFYTDFEQALTKQHAQEVALLQSQLERRLAMSKARHEMLLNFLKRATTQTESRTVSAVAANPLSEPQSIEGRVLRVITAMPGSFTVPDLARQLVAFYPGHFRDRLATSRSISMTLFRARGTKVKVIVPGRGRRLAIYEKL